MPVSKYLSCGTVLSYLLSEVWFNFNVPRLSSTTQYKKKIVSVLSLSVVIGRKSQNFSNSNENACCFHSNSKFCVFKKKNPLRKFKLY